MSVMSEWHKRVDEYGIGRCSVPMWSGLNMPAGFCDQPAYGFRPPRRNKYDGVHAPGLACPDHGGPSVRVFLDGNMYCAVLPDFLNVQESPCGFGDTPQDAQAELARSLGKAQ